MSEAFEQMALRVADDVTEEDGSLDLVAYAKTICAEMMKGNHPVSHLSEIWDGIIERRKRSPSAAARIAELEVELNAAKISLLNKTATNAEAAAMFALTGARETITSQAAQIEAALEALKSCAAGEFFAKQNAIDAISLLSDPSAALAEHDAQVLESIAGEHCEPAYEFVSDAPVISAQSLKEIAAKRRAEYKKGGAA